MCRSFGFLTWEKRCPFQELHNTTMTLGIGPNQHCSALQRCAETLSLYIWIDSFVVQWFYGRIMWDTRKWCRAAYVRKWRCDCGDSIGSRNRRAKARHVRYCISMEKRWHISENRKSYYSFQIVNKHLILINLCIKTPYSLPVVSNHKTQLSSLHSTLLVQFIES